jgi:RHS repeat-associated protein
VVPDPNTIDVSSLDQPLDPAGLIAGMTSIDGTATYSYDAAGQLTGATYSSSNPQSLIPNPSPESYSYDANGNRNMPGYVVGPGNQILSDGTYDYTYDADGNCTSRTSIATGAVTEYTWDNRNRLVEVEDLASAGGPVTQAVDYLYDVENRWIGETVNQENGQPVQATHFAYDGNQIVLQFQGTSATGSASALTAANLSDRYVWGPAVDQLLSDEKVTNIQQPGNVLFALTDNQNTVRDLASYNPQTGTTSVVDHREFNSYGVPVSQTNSSIVCIISYTGRPFDTSTGLQNNLNRWTANCGWWLRQDPTGFAAGQTNLYSYCGNSPVNASDPSGKAGPGEVAPALVVISYFEPINGRGGVNTSKAVALAVAAALQKLIAAYNHNVAVANPLDPQIVTVEVPVKYGQPADVVRNEIAYAHQNGEDVEYWLAIGEVGPGGLGTSMVQIESKARNYRNPTLLDNNGVRGWLPSSGVIDPWGPGQITLPMTPPTMFFLNSIQGTMGRNAVGSTDAGAFVCEEMLYDLLLSQTSHSGVRNAEFVHVPALGVNQNVPAQTINSLAAALFQAILAYAASSGGPPGLPEL